LQKVGENRTLPSKTLEGKEKMLHETTLPNKKNGKRKLGKIAWLRRTCEGRGKLRGEYIAWRIGKTKEKSETRS